MQPLSTRSLPGGFRPGCLGLMLGLMLVLPARAEKYLSLEEARELCFPGAESFEHHPVKFSVETRQQIERAGGSRVPHRGVRAWVASTGAETLGVVVFDQVLGKHELIDYVVAINPAGEVTTVEILEYRESHGDEIRDPKWRSQFTGETSDSDLRLHDDIYNISGATISCRNVTEGVRRVLATYEVVLRPLVGAGGRVPAAAGFTAR